MTDPADAARQVDSRGFCVLPGLFSSTDCDRMTRLLRGHWERVGRPPLRGFGLAIHPLLQHVPEMAPFYATPALVEALAAVLRDDVRVAHTGARLANEESSASIGWHEHYAWEKAGVATRTRPERVLFNCYLHGSTAAAGPLVVMPRRLNDPIEPASADPHAAWPGEVVVEAPPGSVVIFDTALYHTARRGQQSGDRYLWGAHCQGRSNPRPHPEDNRADAPLLRSYAQSVPLLRELLG